MTFVALLIVGVLLYYTEHFIISSHENTLKDNARHTAYNIQQMASLLSLEERQKLLEKMTCEDTGIIYLLVINEDGKAINHSEPGRVGMFFKDEGTQKVLQKGIPVEQVYERDIDNPNSPYHKQKTLDIILPYKDDNGEILGAVNVGLSLDYFKEIRQEYYFRITIASLLIIILIILVSAVFYQDIILPIRNLLTAFQEMKKGNYFQVCTVEKNDELGLLTKEFNTMSARLATVLNDLEIREKELELSKEELEVRVKIRTKELEDNVGKLKLAELALRFSEEKFAATFRLSPQAIALCHYETGRYVEVNDAWLHFTKLKPEEVIGKTFKDINIWNDRQDRDNMLQILRSGGTGNNLEIYFKDINGYAEPFLCSYTTINIGEEKYLLFVANNILDQKIMEEKLKTHQENLITEKIRTSKLESLELLSGGLAHDFNNMLTIIAGNLSLVKLQPLNNEVRLYIDEIEEATLQAQDLTRQLLNFSKPNIPAKHTISTGEFLRRTIEFALRGTSVGCNFFLAPDIHNIEADEGQLRQVFNNLIINAVQSMPNGGTIIVKAENYIAADADFYALSPCDYVVITIEDQGSGISEESKDMIFDPYFTTKEFGSGLGLVTSYAIINKHGGQIWFESEVNKGTTFFIYLPANIGSKT